LVDSPNTIPPNEDVLADNDETHNKHRDGDTPANEIPPLPSVSNNSLSLSLASCTDGDENTILIEDDVLADKKDSLNKNRDYTPASEIPPLALISNDPLSLSSALRNASDIVGTRCDGCDHGSYPQNPSAWVDGNDHQRDGNENFSHAANKKDTPNKKLEIYLLMKPLPLHHVLTRKSSRIAVANLTHA